MLVLSVNCITRLIGMGIRCGLLASECMLVVLMILSGKAMRSGYICQLSSTGGLIH